jgi:hypothetical protein
MKVYICYDRYENNEWFNIYGVGTRKNEEIQKCKKEYLPKFISYGPDDCHSFQLQCVDMTTKEYDEFTNWIKEDQSLEYLGDDSSDLFKKMTEIYDHVGCTKYQNEILLSTDGCSDINDMVHNYGKRIGRDTQDENVYDEILEEITEMDEKDLYDKVLKQYIRNTY